MALRLPPPGSRVKWAFECRGCDEGTDDRDTVKTHWIKCPKCKTRYCAACWNSVVQEKQNATTLEKANFECSECGASWCPKQFKTGRKQANKDEKTAGKESAPDLWLRTGPTDEDLAEERENTKWQKYCLGTMERGYTFVYRDLAEAEEPDPANSMVWWGTIWIVYPRHVSFDPVERTLQVIAAEADKKRFQLVDNVDSHTFCLRLGGFDDALKRSKHQCAFIHMGSTPCVTSQVEASRLRVPPLMFGNQHALRQWRHFSSVEIRAFAHEELDYLFRKINCVGLATYLVGCLQPLQLFFFMPPDAVPEIFFKPLDPLEKHFAKPEGKVEHADVVKTQAALPPPPPPPLPVSPASIDPWKELREKVLKIINETPKKRFVGPRDQKELDEAAEAIMQCNAPSSSSMKLWTILATELGNQGVASWILAHIQQELEDSDDDEQSEQPSKRQKLDGGKKEKEAFSGKL
jgi:hypothetical protein